MNIEVKLEGSARRAVKALADARAAIKALVAENEMLKAKVVEVTAILDAEVPEDTGGSTGGVIG